MTVTVTIHTTTDDHYAIIALDSPVDDAIDFYPECNETLEDEVTEACSSRGLTISEWIFS